MDKSDYYILKLEKEKEPSATKIEGLLGLLVKAICKESEL